MPAYYLRKISMKQTAHATIWIEKNTMGTLVSTNLPLVVGIIAFKFQITGSILCHMIVFLQPSHQDGATIGAHMTIISCRWHWQVIVCYIPRKSKPHYTFA